MPAIRTTVTTTMGHPGEGADGGVESDRGSGRSVGSNEVSVAGSAGFRLSIDRLAAKQLYRRSGRTSRVKLERSTTASISVGTVRSSRHPTLTSSLSAGSTVINVTVAADP